LVRPEVLDALRASELIVHAGDIGHPRVLAQLEKLAPVQAVRGNNDTGPWATAIPETAMIEVGAISLYVIHNVADLEIDPAATGCTVVVAGHSHRPVHELRNGVHFVNPGSAGPRRFHLPVSVARLSVTGADVEVQLIELAVDLP
jgi:putative phosphoesterase